MEISSKSGAILFESLKVPRLVARVMSGINTAWIWASTCFRACYRPIYQPREPNIAAVSNSLTVDTSHAPEYPVVTVQTQNKVQQILAVRAGVADYGTESFPS